MTKLSSTANRHSPPQHTGAGAVRERIERAAVRVDGEVYHDLPPARHHTVLRRMDLEGVDFLGKDEQGFLTSEGRFVDRLEGMAIATAAGQLKRPTGPGFYQGPELFSEDLW